MLITIACILTLVSCSKIFVYDFAMTYPQENSKPQYENDTLSFTMNVQQDGIAFDVLNKTDQGIKIEWDEVSIAVNGKAYKVIHIVNDYKQLNISALQAPTTIPPKSLMTDKLIPINNVATISTSNGILQYLRELFPTSTLDGKRAEREIMKKIGQKITIYLPYYMNGKMISSYYNLKITNIRKVKK